MGAGVTVGIFAISVATISFTAVSDGPQATAPADMRITGRIQTRRMSVIHRISRLNRGFAENVVSDE